MTLKEKAELYIQLVEELRALGRQEYTAYLSNMHDIKNQEKREYYRELNQKLKVKDTELYLLKKEILENLQGKCYMIDENRIIVPVILTSGNVAYKTDLLTYEVHK